MSRNPSRIPPYSLHRPSGQAYVRLDGRFIYLGKFGTLESREKYDREVADWIARRRATIDDAPVGPIVAEVLAAYVAFAEGYYRSKTGKPTGESKNICEAIKPLFKLYSESPARDFGPDELKAVREKMIESGLARTTINGRINRIRRVFKWAASEKLVPVATHMGLTTVDSLRKHRGGVREAPRILPVAQDRIDAVLPHVPSPVAAMIQVQALTGCRVGEIASMRGADVIRDCDPWEYRPGSHKNAYRDDAMDRVIPLGPRARAILEPFLARLKRPEDHLFDPRQAIAEAMGARKGRRKVHRAIPVKPYYDRRAYAQAIVRGCDRAFPHPVLSAIPRRKLTPAQRVELREWRKAHRWSPLRLRHTAATEIRKVFGLEAAQAMLGHARMNTTEIYAEKLLEMARTVAKATG